MPMLYEFIYLESHTSVFLIGHMVDACKGMSGLAWEHWSHICAGSEVRLTWKDQVTCLRVRQTRAHCPYGIYPSVTLGKWLSAAEAWTLHLYRADKSMYLADLWCLAIMFGNSQAPSKSSIYYQIIIMMVIIIMKVNWEGFRKACSQP